MKINLIVILSIIFYTTTLLGSDKEQIVKRVVSYTKEQKTPSTEYILNTFEDKRPLVFKCVKYIFCRWSFLFFGIRNNPFNYLFFV